MPTPASRALLPLFLIGAASSALAQSRFAGDPAAGLSLPASTLAGDQEATATTINPAGLAFLGGFHLEAAFTGLTDDGIQSAGAGAGLYLGAALDPPLLPRLGIGLAVEQLLPPREALAPDPGHPVRMTLATAFGSRALSLGFAWHHSFAHAGVAGGLETFDIGLALRLGARWAAGLVVRNVAPPILEDIPLERHWDIELLSRPLGTDRLELAVAALIGDRRETLHPRARLSVRLARGLMARAAVELRVLDELLDPASGGGETLRTHELRAALGLEVSFGGLGVSAYGIASSGPGRTGLSGATVMTRLSSERYPSILPRGSRIERLKLEGGLGDRELLRNLLTLRRHERDGGVRAVFLQIDNLSAGWATLEELRDAVMRLRARGIKVFAHLVSGGTRDYYLAVAADKIYLDAGGGIRLVGMSSSVMFYKETFDKLGVVAQFEKIEEYKSAPEAFTMQEPSPEARQMRAWILDDVYERFVATVARDRRLRPDEVRRLLDEGPYTAGEAAAAGIVDAVVEPTDVEKLVAVELGGVYPVSGGPLGERPSSWTTPQVAVVYLDGDIVDGKSRKIPIIGQKLVGGETLSKAISWARENGRVKAVVLRVDSPGGSALASDLIAREGFRLRGTKPFIVSIGNVAASGGYYAAAPGDLIYAQPSSITGSIGIFSGKFDLSGLLAGLGVHWDTMTRGAHADMESYLRPYTLEERVLIKQKLRYYYLRFVGAVSRGRSLTEAEVDAVGRGQVWTGAQARERRLVDQHGGILDAILEAKRRAGIAEDEPVELVMLPSQPSSILSRLLGIPGVEAAEIPPLGALGRALPGSLIVDPTVPQARLPFVILDE